MTTALNIATERKAQMTTALNIDDISLFNELRYRLAQITPEQIEAAGRRMGKKKSTDKEVGQITAETTRALYALHMALRAECRMEIASAEACTDEIEEVEHTGKAAVLDMYEDVAREMWWSQAKLDCDFREMKSVGIRQGWILVIDTTPEMPQGLVGLLGRFGPQE